MGTHGPTRRIECVVHHMGHRRSVRGGWAPRLIALELEHQGPCALEGPWGERALIEGVHQVSEQPRGQPFVTDRVGHLVIRGVSSRETCLELVLELPARLAKVMGVTGEPRNKRGMAVGKGEFALALLGRDGESSVHIVSLMVAHDPDQPQSQHSIAAVTRHRGVPAGGSPEGLESSSSAS